ncbi:MAG: 4-hydroxy-tetrahydrodipicolinate synthase [Armatimonadetes bacterium CG07_land_8_20_14_0_80_40_9]|nr:MAG: 4-hydroxy-tetrahydrodipicolinate synthase [Armatimonadetes bacterium CG07_land_8_20_14_0_80_40_9]
MTDLGQVITAMVTPFDKKLRVDYKKAVDLALKLVNSGSDGLLLAGTTGESPTLTHEEEFKLFKVVKEAVGKRASVIAGTGSNSTQTAIDSTVKAEKIGVDACLLVAPYYNKPPQEGLYQHYKKIAESTCLPLIIYNIPGRTGVNILPDTMARLSKIKNIVGVKEASKSVEQAAEIKRKTPPQFLLYSGDDSMTLPLLAVGGWGVISVASHLVGKQISKMIALFFKGEYKKAKELHLRLLPLFKVLFITTNPIPVKAALALTGFDVGSPRLPLIGANKKQKDEIKGVLKEYGLS